MRIPGYTNEEMPPFPAVTITSDYSAHIQRHKKLYSQAVWGGMKKEAAYQDSLVKKYQKLKTEGAQK